jgi:hypothetical protein
MIKISYENGIRIDTENLKGIIEEDLLPLKVFFKNSVTKKVVWQTSLGSNMWASYPNNEMIDVLISDSKDNFIYQYLWDVLYHGSVFYKSLWLYCKSIVNGGRIPNGIAIGTHDGDFGEWCPLVRYNLSDMVLVEGSKKQFDDLLENYKYNQNLTFVNEIITTDGMDVDFFEGGRGYTNSVIERVIRGWEIEEIQSSRRTSISINKLIDDFVISKGKTLDWIHMDVEGLDAQLLMSINEKYLPKFIIFEDYNLKPDEKTFLLEWIKSKGFNYYSNNGICMINK